MPTFKLSHLEARDFICCCCGIKLKSRKKIMPSEETKVKLYCKPDYDSALREQPTGLCSSCRLDLFASARRVQWGGRNPNPREKWDAYELEHGRFKEKEHQPDSCQICLLAHHNPVGEKMRGGEWRRMLQSREPVPPEKKKKKFCTNCYQYIGPGIPHKCTEASAKKNLANIIKDMSTRDQEQVVGECAKSLAASRGTNRVTSMRLRGMRGGNPISVTIGQPKSSRKIAPLNAQFMASLQKKLDCSESKLIMVAREFRRQGVKFEPHIREDLLALSHSLDEFFTVEKISDFVTKNEDNENVPMENDLVYLKDTQEFINHVVEERSLDAESVIYRVGLDGGQVSGQNLSIIDLTIHFYAGLV